MQATTETQEKEIELSVGENTYLVQEDIAKKYQRRSDKQKAIFDIVIDEENPRKPSITLEAIGNEVGAHRSTVSRVLSEYEGLIRNIRNSPRVNKDNSESTSASTQQLAEVALTQAGESEDAFERASFNIPENYRREIEAMTSEETSDSLEYSVGSGKSLKMMIEVLRTLHDRLESIEKTAEAEIEYSTELGPAHGRASVAKEALRIIDENLDEQTQ